MMHQKSKKLLVFDKFKRKSRFRKPNLRYISYSVPLACIMTLIFGLIYGVIFVDSGFNNEEVFAAEIPSSTASMSIESPTLSSNSINPNSIAYLSTNITINAQYIQNYSLTISGNPNLSGPSVITGTSTSTTPANMTNNTWGYNWGNTDTADSTLNYSSLSTMAAALALDPLSNGAANFTKKLTFAVKFGSAETGHYTNDVTLSFTANPKTLIYYNVIYDMKDGAGGPDNYSEFSYDTSKSYTIPFTQPVREGYEFLGWTTNPGATSAETDYTPGKSITLTQASSVMTLYAVWKVQAPLVTGFNGITQMQQMTSSICTSAAANSTGQLYDVRDNSTYTVKKIGSGSTGKCWMTQNLRIVNKTIYGPDISGYDQDSNLDSGVSYTIPVSSDPWSDTAATTQKVYYDNNTTYGAYYSWCTVTANNCSSTTLNSGESAYDICPKGWQLPSSKSGTGTNDFAVAAGLISTKISANTDYWSDLPSRSFANNSLTVNNVTWPAAGAVYSGGLNNAGSSGHYWSRTVYNGTMAYGLNFDSANFKPARNYVSYLGFSVRCVAK